MQNRILLGSLLGVALLALALFLGPFDLPYLLQQRLDVSPENSIPVYAALLAVLAIGLVPTIVLLLVQSLQRDLSHRRNRRRRREVVTLDQRFRRAMDFHADGQMKKASAELEILLTERPNDFAPQLRLGEALRHLGMTQQALEVHRRASVLYPGSVALLYEMAEDYEALGEPEVAREVRNRILRDFPGLGLRVLRRRRDVSMAAGQWEEAVRLHDKIEGLLKDTDDQTGLEKEKGISQGLAYQRGVALLERDRPEDASLIFRKLLQQEPLFVPAGIMLGEAELLNNDEPAALEEWQRGYSETGSPVFLKRIEDYFIEIEEPARAIETLRSLIARTDNDLLLRFFLGRLYFRLEMHEDSLKVLESIGERMDASPTYHYLLGRIRQRRNDQRGSMARYLACLKRLGVSNVTFICRSCESRYPEWQDRCETCGSWNSVDLDVQEEQLNAEDLGVVQLPVWGGYEAKEDAELTADSTPDTRTQRPRTPTP